MANKKRSNDELIDFFLQEIKPSPRVANDLMVATKQTFDFFIAYKEAGFTEKQAFELVKILVAESVKK